MKYAILLLALCQSACAQSPADAINQAKQAHARAITVTGEWRDVGKIIKQAEQALADGDQDMALKLAQTAQHQSEVGYQQALEQKQPPVPAYLR